MQNFVNFVYCREALEYMIAGSMPRTKKKIKQNKKQQQQKKQPLKEKSFADI